MPDRASAGLVLGRHGQSLTRFYVGLRAAAVVDERLPPAPEFTVPVPDGQAAMLPAGTRVEIPAPDGSSWQTAVLYVV